MRILLQRVLEASVNVDGETIASIGPGLLAFVGISAVDARLDATTIREHGRWLADKMLGLRIFADDRKPMNASLLDVDGELLIVSQFTLEANLSKGRRPSFDTAAVPNLAEPIFDAFVSQCRVACSSVLTGRFGADMAVSLINDGPVTLLLER